MDNLRYDYEITDGNEKARRLYDNNKILIDKKMLLVEPDYDTINLRDFEKLKFSDNIEERFLLDSRERDLNLYPEPNNYLIQFNKEYRNVSSVELIRAIIPQSQYIVDNYNNKIIIEEEQGKCQTITLDNGDYSIDQIMKQIKFKICLNNHLKSNYDVTFDCITNKVSIKSDLSNGYFKIMFCNDITIDNNNLTGKVFNYNNRSLGKLLGYNAFDYGYAQGVILGLQKIDGQNSTSCECGLSYSEISTFLSKLCSKNTITNTQYNYYKVLGFNTKFKSQYNIADTIKFEDYDCDSQLINHRYLIIDICSDTEMYVIEISNGTCKTTNCTESVLKESGSKCYCEPYCVAFCNCLSSGGVLPYSPGTTSYIFDPPIKAYLSNIVANAKYDLFFDQYVILKIPGLERLQSNSNNVNDAFTIFTLNLEPNSRLVLDKALGPDDKEIKYYNPPLGRLANMKIIFTNYDGSLYNFNGREHYLEFRVKMLNRPSKVIN